MELQQLSLESRENGGRGDIDVNKMAALGDIVTMAIGDEEGEKEGEERDGLVEQQQGENL